MASGNVESCSANSRGRDMLTAHEINSPESIENRHLLFQAEAVIQEIASAGEYEGRFARGVALDCTRRRSERKLKSQLRPIAFRPNRQ